MTRKHIEIENTFVMDTLPDIIIPDTLIKSWAIAQKAEPEIIRGLVEKYRNLRFFKLVGIFLIVIAVFLLFLSIFADFKQTDKLNTRYEVVGMTLVGVLSLVFRPKFAKDEITILNCLKADFKALTDLVKTVNISSSRLYKSADEPSANLEGKLNLNHVDPAHSDYGDFILKTMRSSLACWCWMALRDLALKVKKIDDMAAVVRECGQPADEGNDLKKQKLKSSIEEGIATGRKFLLFSGFVGLGAFFD